MASRRTRKPSASTTPSCSPRGRRRSWRRRSRAVGARGRAGRGPTPARRRRAGRPSSPSSSRRNETGPVRHDHHRSAGHAGTLLPDLGVPDARRCLAVGDAGSAAIGKHGAVRVVAAPDKFRGTASAAEVAAADRGRRPGARLGLRRGAGGRRRRGHARRARRPEPHDGRHRSARRPRRGRVAPRRATAVIEMARASGLLLVGGAEGNDPIGAVDPRHRRADRRRRSTPAPAASSSASAARPPPTAASARCGPCTRPSASAGVELDRRLRRDDPLRRRRRRLRAAEGRAPAQVALLRRRLERLAQVYVEDYGVDVTGIDGGGRGRRPRRWPGRGRRQLVPGFDLVADELDLAEHARGRRPGRHRRGLPRRAVLRGQGGRRRRRAGRRIGVPVAGGGRRGLRRRRAAGSMPCRSSSASAGTGPWPTRSPASPRSSWSASPTSAPDRRPGSP